MRVLIADDELVSRRHLEAALVSFGYDVVVTKDGQEAWQALRDEAPRLAVLDWMMPGMDGIEICRKVRETAGIRPAYIILLTVKGEEHLVEGLRAGADDYITKPFDAAELEARLQVGARVTELQIKLADRVRELEDALSQVKQLRGLLPICSYCKKVRDDKNYWQQVESYIEENSEAKFSHGVCPDCYEKFLKPQLQNHPERRKD
jgi:DNA-binding response OmpR family regulator